MLTTDSLRTAVAAFYAAFSIPLLLFGVIVLLLWNKYAHGLHRIPGPSLAAYTGLWRLYDLIRGHAQQTAIELHRKHGPLVRVGPKHVSVGDPDAIPQIYGLKANFTKVDHVSRFSSALGS